MIDLTSYAKISSAQNTASKQIVDLVAIANLNKDEALNIDTTIKAYSIDSVTISGNKSNITTGYLVIGGEIVAITNSSYNSGTNQTTFTITREQYGTKKALFNIVDYPIRSVHIFPRILSFEYDNANANNNDLFSFVLEQGNVKILDNVSNWVNTSPTQIYDLKRLKSAVYLFYGFNGERVLKYTGFPFKQYNYVQTTNRREHISISFNDKFVLWFNKTITNNIEFKYVYPKTMLSKLLDNYPLSQIYYANGNIEEDFNTTNYFFSKEFKTYGEALSAFAKSGVRFCFDELERIKITSDIKIDNITPVNTVDIDNNDILDLNITDDENLKINKITGKYYERGTLYNFADLDNKYVYYKYSKTNIYYKMLTQNNNVYDFSMLSIQNEDICKKLKRDDIVILKDKTTGLEFHGKVINFSENNTVEIMIGFTDKDSSLVEFGKKDYLIAQGFNQYRLYDIYYVRNTLPIIWKYQKQIDNETRSSNLKIALRPQVNGQLENSLISEIKFGSPENLELGKYTGYYEEIADMFGTWDNTKLLYNRELLQFSNTAYPNVFLLSNRISTPLGRTNEKYVKYDVFDNSNVEVSITTTKNENDAIVKFKNTTAIEPSALIDINSYTLISPRLIRINKTEFDLINVGDVLTLKAPATFSSVTEANEFNLNKNTNWIILFMQEDSGQYYIFLDGDIRDTFKFTVFPATSIVYLQEFYIMGNPIIEYENPVSIINQTSIDKYGELEYTLDGKYLDYNGMRRMIDYFQDGFSAVNSNGSDRKYILNVPIRNNLELQKYDIITIKDDLFSKITNTTKWIILGEKVNDAKSGNKITYTLMNLNSVSADENDVELGSVLEYKPVKDVDYNHQGNEGSPTEVVNDLFDTNVVNAEDDTYGRISYKPISPKEFNAKVDIYNDTIITYYDVKCTSEYVTYLYKEDAIILLSIDNELILCRVELSPTGRAYNTGIYNKGKYGGYTVLKVIKRKVCKSEETIIKKDKIIRGNIIVSGNIDGEMISNSAEIRTMNDNNEIVFKPRNKGVSYIKIDKGGTGGYFSVGDITSKSYMQYQEGNSLPYENGFSIEAHYINKTAYCSNSLEFVGALDTSKENIKYNGTISINPYYKKTVNNIVLLNKDTTTQAYDISLLDVNHFGTSNAIIPSEDIDSITSIFGESSTTIKCDNTYIKIDYPIKINGVKFENLGYGNYSIQNTSQSVILSNLRFKNIQKRIFGQNRTGFSIYNLIIESYDSAIPRIFEAIVNINNVTVWIDSSLTDVSSSIFYLCKNINNIAFLTLDSSNFYSLTLFNLCVNITNIFLQELDIEIVANGCNNMSNIFGEFYADRTSIPLTNYLFKQCYQISNIRFLNPSYYDKWFSTCDYLNNINATLNSAHNINMGSKIDTNTVSW